MLQNELFQYTIVYYFQNCLSNLCYDVTSDSFIFGMIIVLADFVTDYPNLSEDQQTLSALRVFYNLHHTVLQKTCLDSDM